MRLKTASATLQEQNQQQDQTINQQYRQINAAWYAIGTKRELKDHNILKSGDVLQGDFDASYFTEIDIRRVSQINLNSKKAEILTNHPEGTYTLGATRTPVSTPSTSRTRSSSGALASIWSSR